MSELPAKITSKPECSLRLVLVPSHHRANPRKPPRQRGLRVLVLLQLRNVFHAGLLSGLQDGFGARKLDFRLEEKPYRRHIGNSRRLPGGRWSSLLSC